MKQKVFKFSIVMAVYNTEPFLRETIASVLSQDIGFEENVQLILIDDGSTDGSGELCDRFASLYPENIVCIHKENGGVSSARNEGIKRVEGEFVNFMDSDDKFSIDAFRKVYEFFSAHKQDVDIVSVPEMLFDGWNGSHILNDKYRNGTRVIDLRKEPEHVLMGVSYCFIKKEIFNDILFCETLEYGEDSRMAWEI